MKLKKIFLANGKEILFVFIAFFLMVLVSYLFIGNIVEKQIALTAREMLHTIEAFIYAEYRGAEAALLAAAFSIQTRLDYNQSLEQIKTYRDVLKQWHTGYGSGMSGFINIYGYIQGQFVGLIREPGGEGSAEGGADLMPWNYAWYTEAKNSSDKVAAPPPYIDAYTGRIVSSLSKILKNPRGEDYGVIALDVDISKVIKYVKSFHSGQKGYGMLTDQNLVFIAHPNSYYIGKGLEEISESHGKLAKELRTGLVAISAVKLKNHDGSNIIGFFKRMFNGWYVGIATEVSNYYQSIYFMALILISLGFILMIVLCYFLIRLGIAKMSSEEKSRGKSSFIARMSHEIRTPMNSILGMSELVMRKDISDEVYEYVSIINQAGISLLAITNDILDFSKIESTHFQIEEKKYFFSSLINDVVNMMRIRFMDKPVEFYVYVDADIPARLTGDEIRIRQVLINLLSNAVKYTRQGFVSLDVHYKKIDDTQLELIFTVTDSGIGIKEKDIKNLFNDFSRADNNCDYHIEGTGLGLSIARTLCRAMAGDITVSSEYGKGSIFTARIIQDLDEPKKLASVPHPETIGVLLYEEQRLCLKYSIAAMEGIGIDPVCPGSLADLIAELERGEYHYAFVPLAKAEDCITALKKNGSPVQLIIMMEFGKASPFRNISSIMTPVYSITIANIFNGVIGSTIHHTNFIAPSARVLIVDDIATNLQVAKELMAPYKMEIHTCTQGMEAIEMVKNNYYDIVFLDHMMPEMDGLETAAAIHTLNRSNGFQRPSIIMLTANAGSEQRDMFLRNSIDDLLEKPIEIKRLNALLERWTPKEKQIITYGDQTPAMPQATQPCVSRKTIDIPQVNVLSGLNNTGGSMAVYLNILSNFYHEAKDQAEQIKQAAETANVHLYTILIHGLKGSAQSIGADEFSGFTSRIEEKINQGDIRVIEDKTGELLENLGTLTDNIHTALTRNIREPEIRTETNISKPQLQVLKDALIKMDIEMVNKLFMEYTFSRMTVQTRDIITEIEKDVLMFEYEKAIEKIDSYLYAL
jgi:signal transduction histidine kinase/response regulator of citrate/malate metabolism